MKNYRSRAGDPCCRNCAHCGIEGALPKPKLSHLYTDGYVWKNCICTKKPLTNTAKPTNYVAEHGICDEWERR